MMIRLSPTGDNFFVAVKTFDANLVLIVKNSNGIVLKFQIRSSQIKFHWR